MWLLVLFCLILGIFIGFQLPLFLPDFYAKYMSIAVLAALDSVFGGIRAYIEETFDNTVFITGFITNTLLAAAIAYLGDRLGVELYLAAVIVFGVRIFQNLGIIRRYLIKKY
ncbi:Small basic protein Sbp [Candidatus Syntrophocurvum alkaliphilum]|uniref:Small basic protein Sbp n=1 Tax=Candidatus Syntrophocurvum alkaliphilum TaxID=2293317 RepID=A0A6I6DFE3_9FIRM|nr:small basic family protein [Candidatus Syntrophocurvum alkaliphilum]QGT99141.1 Small basic protein Sbp [Candidatus Syntrophocurvum alkaliphilum]